jgi:dipeptide/tripeptide permease
MTDVAKIEEKPTWRFSKEFWLANLMELCERAAYYGFFIVLTLYLSAEFVGFNDRETAWVAGIFFALLYLLPTFLGAVADKIGFKRGLILAFFLLSVGYFLLGIVRFLPELEWIRKTSVVLFLAIAMVGGSFIKALITGTVAKTTNEANRARGFALFYWVVNIGAFGGKTVVPSIRQEIGLEYVNFFSAGMTMLALLVALFLFKPIGTVESNRTLRDVWRALIAILTTPRLIILTLIVTGFWMIQHQLYATMPKYVIRLLGEDARPEWLANVNPLTVVIFVVLITQLMKKRQAVTSMVVGMLLMPFSALAMAGSQSLESYTGSSVDFGVVALHPLTVMMIIGIAIQGLAECFISPRFLEYFSRQAPKGEEGLYMGFSHLHSFLSALFGFGLSGYLLTAYCPDPRELPEGLTAVERAAYYEHAHYIWYYFAVIGVTAAIALLIFRAVTRRIDAQKAQESTAEKA